MGERSAKFADLTKNTKLIDHTHRVFAGKFRRYHGVRWWQKLLDVPTLLYNVRDLLFVCIGLVQAWFLLGRIKPSVVFLKGGYVGVPVGLAASFRKIPIVTHDSDAIPGLANRIAGRTANVHAVAVSADVYDYPKEKIEEVGVLVEQAYTFVTPKLMQTYRQQLSLPRDGLVLLVTGGSSGAVAINEVVAECADELLHELNDLVIVHQVGKGKSGIYEGFHHQRLHVYEFLNPMPAYMGAADLVVTRGSANTIAELAVQGKAAVVIPSPYLANGHQLKNAEMLVEQGSAVVLQESMLYDPQHGFKSTVLDLLKSKQKRRDMADVLHSHAPNDAATRVAELLYELGDPSASKEKHKL